MAMLAMHECTRQIAITFLPVTPIVIGVAASAKRRSPGGRGSA